MKHIFAILAISFCIASCKKNYNCKCITSGTANGISINITSDTTISSSKESSALRDCNSLGGSVKAPDIEINTVCSLM